MNDFLYAGAYVVAENLRKMKKSNSNEKQKKHWWKRRIQENIAQWRKCVSTVNERRRGTVEFEKKDLDRMERKYKMSAVGNVQVIDILKGKISAGAKKIIQYEERELITIKTPCLQRTRSSFTRNLMVVATFQIKPLILKKLLNFGAIFG